MRKEAIATDNFKFYKSIFGECLNSKLGITTIDTNGILQTRYYANTDIDNLVSAVERLGKDKNVYFNICPRKSDISKNERGTANDVTYLSCIGSDFDVKSPAHTEQNLPPDKESILELISSVLPTPTFTVDTGHGIDAFWVFETPYKIGDNISLEKAKSIISGWGKHLADIFNFSDWKIDNVYDLSRMLRAPGSINHKLSDGAECKIITDTNIYYKIEDFEPYRIDQISSECIPFDTDKRTIGSAERIMQKCLFVQKMINDANGVTEPEWKALCSNISLTPDGHDKFHEWSSLYNDYSHDETERKIMYSARANKPCTCRYIHENLGFACPIGGCGVKAPIVFAQYSKEEQIKNMLNDSNLKAEDMLNDYELNLSVYAKEHLPIQYGKIKLMARRLKLSIRDFENAVKCKAAKSAAEEFNAEPAVIAIAGLNTNGAKEPQGYNVTENGIYSIKYDNGIPIPIQISSSPIIINKRLENIDSSQEKLELSFLRNDKTKSIVAPRSVILNKNTLTKLADNGLPVTSSNAEDLVRYISAYETDNNSIIPFIRSISRIGWIDNEFFPYCTDNDIIYEGTDEENIVNAICENGSFDAWLETAKEIRNNPFARAILNASLASPLLEKLQNRIIILHIWHSSRSGKTAALKFALSVWGDPLRLVGSYNATAVGLERQAGILKHLPLGLDELQVLNEYRLSAAKIVYSLGNGCGKIRGAKSGGLQNTYTWRNTIISTGEQPLSSETSMDGVNSRVLELYGAPIENFEQGRNVHQISENNYGYAGKRYIEYLITNVLNDKPTIKEDYEEIRNKLRRNFAEEPGIHFDNIAVLALADYYASKSLFGLNADAALTEALSFGITILKNAKSLEKEDVIERAWHFVEDWVASNKSRFDNLATPCYGKIESGKVYIIASVLREALTDNGFNYTKSIKGFKDKGYINTFDNTEGKQNIQCQKKIRGVNVRTICALIDVTATDSFLDNDFLKDPLPSKTA